MDHTNGKAKDATVMAYGHLKNDVAKQGIMMLQGTDVSVVNAEELGDTSLVRIMPQKGILPVLTKPMFVRIDKDDIILALDGLDELLDEMDFWNALSDSH